jgi:hypothetical protein
MFKKLKKSLWHKKIKQIRKSNLREKRMCSLEKASKIGLFLIYDESDFKTVNDFARKLKEEGKKVEILSFINKKRNEVEFHPVINCSFYFNDELSFCNIPNNTDVDNFIQKNFDILIDFNLYKNAQNIYIATASKAAFKIGIDINKEENAHDLSFNATSCLELLEILQHYSHNFE